MDRTEFLKLIDEVLEKDPGTTTGGESLDDLGWDSLSAVSFLALVSDRLDKEITPEDLLACTTVQDLAVLAGAA